jgi:hypothetical protein
MWKRATPAGGVKSVDADRTATAGARDLDAAINALPLARDDTLRTQALGLLGFRYVGPVAVMTAGRESARMLG